MYSVYSDFNSHFIAVPVNSPTERMINADRRNRWRKEFPPFSRLDTFNSPTEAYECFRVPIYELGTHEPGSYKYE